MRLAILLAGGALALASCAGTSLARRDDTFPQPPAAAAVAVGDPGARFTTQEARAVNPLESIGVGVALGPPSPPRVTEALTPSLDGTEALEMRQSFGACVWRPMLDAAGAPLAGRFTLLFQTSR